MKCVRTLRVMCVALPAAALSVLSTPALADLNVVTISPARNAINVAPTAPIIINFDRPADPATFTAANLVVYARWNGRVAGNLAFSNGNQTLTLTPDLPYAAGDIITVLLSHNLLAADASPVRPGGYTYTFTTSAGTSRRVFRSVQSVSNRSPNNAQTRIYGALACDLDGDRFLDLTTINEVSADIRVFMNRDDGSARFLPFLTPPRPIAFESSANEPGDFNSDGNADVATVSSTTGQLCVVLGNGNGTFQPTQYIQMGGQGHGVAVLDADGDGDLDVVTANTGSNNLAITLNNGAGVFAPAVAFEGGGDGEYALNAADMNNDGLMDLVCGNRFSQTITILRGNGNGTFTFVSSRNAGGLSWQIVCGDVNGDGNMDVSSANDGSNNGSILLGNGNGTVQPPVITPTAQGAISTRLADVDGDGDLDWLLSSHQGGRWRLFTNNGAGTFTFDQEFVAPSNPACSVVADLDNDRDLDIVLLDEIADLVIVMESVCPPDWNEDNALNSQDFFDFLADFFGTGADYNNNGITNSQDFFDFLAAFFAGC